MTSVETIERYRTSDGVIFEYLEAAEAHQEDLDAQGINEAIRMFSHYLTPCAGWQPPETKVVSRQIDDEISRMMGSEYHAPSFLSIVRRILRQGMEVWDLTHEELDEVCRERGWDA